MNFRPVAASMLPASRFLAEFDLSQGAPRVEAQAALVGSFDRYAEGVYASKHCFAGFGAEAVAFPEMKQCFPSDPRFRRRSRHLRSLGLSRGSPVERGVIQADLAFRKRELAVGVSGDDEQEV